MSPALTSGVTRSACTVLALLCLAGCDSAGKVYPSGALTGKVTLDGAPVNSGQVVFVSEDPKATGKELFAMQITGGMYFFGGIPAGKYNGYIMGSTGTPGPKGAEVTAAPSAGSPVSPPTTPGATPGGGATNVPKKYQSPTTSGFSVQVNAGTENKLDLTMTK